VDSSVLSSYKSEGDPSLYSDVYNDLTRFIESSLDIYRHELALILYPVFVHMYLELVYNGHEVSARDFVTTFGPRQESFYQDDIKKLSYITRREHMRGSELMENFRTSQFTVRMSRDTYTQLRQQKKFMSERKHVVLWNIIQEHLYLDVYEGIARNRGQISSTAGGVIGEANRQANRAKIFYGLPREPDLSAFVMDDDSEEEVGDGKDGEKPKKKKPKKDPLQLRKQRTDPNAPSAARMPLPELRDVDKAERAKALREITRRLQLSADTLPSICHYTVLNSCSSLCAVEVTDDSSMVALGFADSIVKVWSLNPHKLKGLKSADALDNLNRDADDVLHRMMDEGSSDVSKTLSGHSGPVSFTLSSFLQSLVTSSSHK
jgi:transcription initiation factor TFIID subunit 5